MKMDENGPSKKKTGHSKKQNAPASSSVANTGAMSKAVRPALPWPLFRAKTTPLPGTISAKLRFFVVIVSRKNSQKS